MKVAKDDISAGVVRSKGLKAIYTFLLAIKIFENSQPYCIGISIRLLIWNLTRYLTRR